MTVRFLVGLSLNGGNYLNGNYTFQLAHILESDTLSLNGGNYLNGNGIILTAVNCPVVDKLSLNGGNYLNGNIISNVKYFEKVF